MVTAAASLMHHRPLSSSLRYGSSLASFSGVSGSWVSGVGAPKASQYKNQRNLRFVRPLPRLQQRSPAFTASACPSPSSDCGRSKLNSLGAKRRESFSCHSLQSARLSVSYGNCCILSSSTVGPLRHTRITAAGGESQAADGEEGKEESTSSTVKSVVTNEKPTTSETPAPSPFTAGKISSKIASTTTQLAENGKNLGSPPTKQAPTNATTVLKDTSKPASNPVANSSPSVLVQAPTSKPSFSVKPKSLIDDNSQGFFPTGKVSPFAADRLKSQMSSPPSQYNRTSSGRTMINSGKQVLEAFKQGERDGKTTKFGQPIVPKNIFDDVRQTAEEKEADKFQFSLKPGESEG